MLNANVSGCSFIALAKIVDLPPPDGPVMMIGLIIIVFIVDNLRDCWELVDELAPTLQPLMLFVIVGCSP
jgi:hypothetical protein